MQTDLDLGNHSIFHQGRKFNTVILLLGERLKKACGVFLHRKKDSSLEVHKADVPP